MRRDARAAVLGWRLLAYGPVALRVSGSWVFGFADLWSDLEVLHFWMPA